MKKVRSRLIGKRVMIFTAYDDMPWDCTIVNCFEEFDAIHFTVKFEDGIEYNIDRDSVAYYSIVEDKLIKHTPKKKKFKKGHLTLVK